jgi:hypothetical protein
MIGRTAFEMFGRPNTAFAYGIYRGAEAEDPNLSKVEIPGTEGSEVDRVRWVPKLRHVTGLSNGDTVLCTKSPYVIIGVVVGDVTLAEVPD